MIELDRTFVTLGRIFMSQVINKKDSVYEMLKNRIMSGEYEPEAKLPKEVEFAGLLGVGRITLRSALDRLCEEGVIKRIPGKGTFVSGQNELNPRNCLIVLHAESQIESPSGYIMSGIEQRSREFYMKLTRYSRDILCSSDIRESVCKIRENKFDGIFYLVNSINGDEKDFIILKETGLPVIIPHGSYGDYIKTGFAVMQTNEREAFGAGIKALFNKGHRRIATMFMKRPKLAPVRGFYLDEYLEFLKGTGCRGDHAELTEYCSYNYKDISAAVTRMLRLSDPPTAIMCFSDFFAIHVYKVLNEMKIRIPEQIAVMGYCGYPGSNFLSPPLSTVDTLFENVGRKAVELMAMSREWHRPGVAPPEIFTPFAVIEKESTGVLRMDEHLSMALNHNGKE